MLTEKEIDVRELPAQMRDFTKVKYDPETIRRVDVGGSYGGWIDFLLHLFGL